MIKKLQNNGKSYLCFLGIFLFLFCMFWAFLSSLFHSNLSYDPCKIAFFQNFFLFLFSLLFLGGSYWFYQFLKKRENSFQKLWIITLVFVFLLLFLEGITYFARVEPSWDFKVIYRAALDYLQGNVIPFTNEYFSWYPNNLFLLLLEVCILKIGQFFSLKMGAMLFFNALFINLAIVFLFLYLKRQYSFLIAIMGLWFCLFLTPIYFYTPIFYSDTFSIFLPILLLYLSTFLDEKNSFWKNFFWVFLLSFFTVVGFYLKVSVCIMMIAILLSLFLQKDIRFFLKIFGVFLCLFCFTY